jgi:hypothetical protein
MSSHPLYDKYICVPLVCMWSVMLWDCYESLVGKWSNFPAILHLRQKMHWTCTHRLQHLLSLLTNYGRIWWDDRDQSTPPNVNYLECIYVIQTAWK